MSPDSGKHVGVTSQLDNLGAYYSFLDFGVLDCSKYRLYRKKEKSEGGEIVQEIDGIIANNRHIHKYIDYNRFAVEPTPISKGFRMVHLKQDWVAAYRCGNLKHFDELEWNKSIHTGYITHLTHDNGGRPFLVALKNSLVKVYMLPPNTWRYGEVEIKRYHYSHLVAEFKPKKIFTGNSPGDGPKFKANSFLLKLPKNIYVFIGHSVYKFTSTDDIVEYASAVGNSDVPYPVALGKENVYFMLDHAYVSNAHIPPGLTKKQKLDMYTFYYNGHSNAHAMKEYKENMKNYKLIQKSPFR